MLGIVLKTKEMWSVSRHRERARWTGISMCSRDVEHPCRLLASTSFVLRFLRACTSGPAPGFDDPDLWKPTSACVAQPYVVPSPVTG